MVGEVGVVGVHEAAGAETALDEFRGEAVVALLL